MCMVIWGGLIQSIDLAFFYQCFRDDIIYDSCSQNCDWWVHAAALALFYIFIYLECIRCGGSPDQQKSWRRHFFLYLWLVTESKITYVVNMHWHLKSREIMCSWHLYLGPPEIHFCPPASVFLGIFSPFHSLCRDDVPVLYSSSQKMSKMSLSLAKHLSVELFYQGLTSPGLCWRCLHV